MSRSHRPIRPHHRFHEFCASVCAVAAIALLCCMPTSARGDVISVDGLDALPGKLQLSAHGPQLLDAGFGYLDLRRSEPCLTQVQRAAMLDRVEANIRALTAEGKLSPGDPQKIVLFDWPLAPAETYPEYDYHAISNFIDRDSRAPGAVLDYNCGARSYDLDNGYNHLGTDIFTWPFAWNLMDDDQVHVVAGEGGIIVDKVDGNYDRSCGIGGGTWNAVVVRHADNSIVYYGHMKNGSTTTKPVGAWVNAGEYLGVVGSSGNSTEPHLHMEIYDAAHALVDPWNGPCNTAPSWWADQRPYYDSAINAVKTHHSPPSFQPCPEPAIINAADRFDPGDLVYFAAYYHDQLDEQVGNYRVLRPDGSVFASWNHSGIESHYAASYWYFSLNMPMVGPLGVWRFEVDFEGVTYGHDFMVSAKVAIGEEEPPTPRRSVLTSYPNPFNPSTTIRFELEQAGPTRLTIHDLAGRRVAVLVDEIRRSGPHTLVWDGRDDSSLALSSGVYFVRLQTQTRAWSRKIVLSK